MSQEAPTGRDKEQALAIVKRVDMRFENSERLRLGKWVAPEERQNTIAGIIAQALASARREAAAVEREACVKIAENHVTGWHPESAQAITAEQIAAAIRVGPDRKDEE
jgi:hypothetical protein